MTGLRRLWLVVPALILLGFLIAGYVTRGSMEELSFLRRSQSGDQGPVDQSPAETAVTLAPQAVSAEEQGFAQDAVRLGEHEVDLAFAMALRQASTQHKALDKRATETAGKVEALKATVAQDKAAVDAATADAAKSGAAPEAGDDVDVAKAQLALDTDDLQDETADLARESDDQRTKIQAEAQARQSAVKRTGPGAGESAVRSVKRHGTLWARATAWFDQRSRVKLIDEAGGRAVAEAQRLNGQHDALKANNDREARGIAGLSGAARVKLLDAMASERVVMSILDDRAQAETELAGVYGKWDRQVWMQHRIVNHLLLNSGALIALIVLLAAGVTVGGRMLVGRLTPDARRRGTLVTIFELAVQVIAVVAIVLVVWGPPEQLTTILGLTTAGLTVVFQDFILAFFGWFVLMGRNGIRVCDWVEINGTGGEVSEIGLFRTTLLETGNWTSRGHPTGRKVSFTNSFAIRGTYFNYTTHGQWMWDEIKLTVGADAYKLMGRLQEVVETEAAKDSEEAGQEWQSASGQVGLGQFTAKPTVDLRPAGDSAGANVVVRFITRAGERFDRRNRIFDEVMRVLREGSEVVPKA